MVNRSSPEPTAALETERDEAARTLYQLAHQVGIKCADCGTILRPDDIGAVSYMAPYGTTDYTARGYCRDCAAAFCDDDPAT